MAASNATNPEFWTFNTGVALWVAPGFDKEEEYVEYPKMFWE